MRSERDVTAEFVELMCALDGLVEGVEGKDLAALDLGKRVLIGRCVVAHREFRELCERYDVVVGGSEVRRRERAH
jgi:hypothetical protein